MSIPVLIIDRERELVESIADALANTDLHVRTAWRLDQVLAALAEHAPQVIICHPNVPDGELTEADLMDILQDYPAALIIMSARPFHQLDGVPERAIALSKPFGRPELLAAIEQAVASA
jgi:DNA-binding NtrC family response regulator